MTLIEQIDRMKFTEDDLRFYFGLVSLEAFASHERSALILVAAARHLNAMQRELPGNPPDSILGQFVDLARFIAPPPPPRRPKPKLTLVAMREPSFSSTPPQTGADNA